MGTEIEIVVSCLFAASEGSVETRDGANINRRRGGAEGTYDLARVLRRLRLRRRTLFLCHFFRIFKLGFENA